MAKKLTNAERVVIDGDSATAFDDWLHMHCDLLLADVLSVARAKTRTIVHERRRLLKMAVGQWMMQEAPGGAVVLARRESKVPIPEGWHELRGVVVARLFGYGDESAVSRVLYQIREAEWEAPQPPEGVTR